MLYRRVLLNRLFLQGGAAGGGRGRGRVARRRTGGPGAAGGDAPAAGADEGDDDGGEWAYINTTHIVADITVEEVPSPEPAASGGSAGGARPGETTSAQVRPFVREITRKRDCFVTSLSRVSYAASVTISDTKA